MGDTLMDTSLLDALEETTAAQGQLLGIVPVEGTGTALVIVGHHVRLGRPDPAPPPRHEDGLTLDLASRTATIDDRNIPLTYQEFELLAHLTASPGRVYSRAQLLRAVWDYETGSARTVDVHIHRLRRKIGPYRDRIITVRRLGYMYARA